METIIIENSNRFMYPIIAEYHESKRRMALLIDKVNELFSPVDNIIFYGTGTSGAMCLAMLLELNPNYNVCLVAKGDSGHHRSSLEYSLGTNPSNSKSIFVDDIIGSGDTAHRVMKKAGIDKFDAILAMFAQRRFRNNVKYYTHKLITFEVI